MTEYFATLAAAVATQLVGVLGIFFLFGFLLSKIQTITHRRYHESVGWKGILWTAWLGTPVHEVGHLILAKLFRHRIERFALFEPDKETGNLGYVDHSFAKYGLYQRIGNFFIGAAPLIFGSTFLVLLLYFLAPNGKEVFAPLSQTHSTIAEAGLALNATLKSLFSLDNLSTWNFWLFLYVSFCIVSHMAPSKKDRAGMWNGLAWIALILCIVNGVALLLHHDLTAYILRVNQYLGIFVGMYVYALILAILHFILATIVLAPFRKFKS